MKQATPGGVSSSAADPEESIRGHLEALYGPETGAAVHARLRRLLEDSRSRLTRPNPGRRLPEGSGRISGAQPDPSVLPLDERDAILITYGDQFRDASEAPLATLRGFLGRHLRGALSGVHILPFFPFSSDDGFSVVDFREVNPEWGGWSDLEAIGREFRLMFDLVLNHASAHSRWFQAFLRDEDPFSGYFIEVPEGTDLSAVFRPRALPLLTRVRTPSGEKQVWTTFSADQVDLNYQNPEVLLEMIRTLLLYVEKGAQIIRLDAVAYLWKEIGTPCIHLPQCHRVVQLFRSVFDRVAPWVLIITETNVPHRDNISYFGDGTNEAQLVYQFSLPPLVLDAFLRSDAGHLRRWASDLGEPQGNITFFNFLASHDGVGVMPAKGILSDAEINGLAAMVESRGGRVSYKSTPAGKIPYELNIAYFDGIVRPEEAGETKVRKFLCSQAIMLAFRGVPGIYIHSLCATPNYLEGVRNSGINRTINRRKFLLPEIENELARPGSLAGQVFRGYRELLEIRRANPAFHPFAAQRVIDSPREVFAYLRTPSGGGRPVLCVFNTSEQRSVVRVAARELACDPGAAVADLTAGSALPPLGGPAAWHDDHLEVPLEGYEFRWLAGQPA